MTGKTYVCVSISLLSCYFLALNHLRSLTELRHPTSANMNVNIKNEMLLSWPPITIVC